MTDTRRVVITGIGLASPIGNTLREATASLKQGEHGVGTRSDWDEIGNLGARLAAEVTGLDLSGYSRKKIRTMGRVALLATYTTQVAIDDAAIDRAITELRPRCDFVKVLGSYPRAEAGG